MSLNEQLAINESMRDAMLGTGNSEQVLVDNLHSNYLVPTDERLSTGNTEPIVRLDQAIFLESFPLSFQGPPSSSGYQADNETRLKLLVRAEIRRHLTLFRAILMTETEWTWKNTQDQQDEIPRRWSKMCDLSSLDLARKYRVYICKANNNTPINDSLIRLLSTIMVGTTGCYLVTAGCTQDGRTEANSPARIDTLEKGLCCLKGWTAALEQEIGDKSNTVKATQGQLAAEGEIDISEDNYDCYGTKITVEASKERTLSRQLQLDRARRSLQHLS